TRWYEHGFVITSRVTITPRLLLSLHAEDDSEACFSAHHPFVSFTRSLEREDFIHRLHAGQRAELERVLRIDRRAGIPALHRTATADEQNGIDGEWAGRADHHEHTVRVQTTNHRGHGVGVRHSRDDDFGAAQFVEFRSRIFL